MRRALRVRCMPHAACRRRCSLRSARRRGTGRAAGIQAIWLLAAGWQLAGWLHGNRTERGCECVTRHARRRVVQYRSTSASSQHHRHHLDSAGIIIIISIIDDDRPRRFDAALLLLSLLFFYYLTVPLLMPILRSKKPSTASPLPSPSLAEHTLSTSATPSQPIVANSPLKESGGPLFPSKSSTTPRLLVTEDWSNDPESPTEINIRTTMSGHPDTEISLTSPTAASEVRYDGRHSRRESLVQRVTDKLNSPANGEEKKRRSRRSRRASTSSAVSQGRTISTALAKGSGGLSAGQPEDVIGKRAVSTGRSPYLIRAHGDDSDEGYGSEDDSEHESDNEGLDHLPVTGFAVASNRRNAEFHALFPTVDEGDYLIEGMDIPPLTPASQAHMYLSRLWMRARQGYPRPWSTVRLREPYLLSLESVRLGDRCKCPTRCSCTDEL